MEILFCFLFFWFVLFFQDQAFGSAFCHSAGTGSGSISTLFQPNRLRLLLWFTLWLWESLGLSLACRNRFQHVIEGDRFLMYQVTQVATSASCPFWHASKNTHSFPFCAQLTVVSSCQAGPENSHLWSLISEVLSLGLPVWVLMVHWIAEETLAAPGSSELDGRKAEQEYYFVTNFYS